MSSITIQRPSRTACAQPHPVTCQKTELKLWRGKEEGSGGCPHLGEGSRLPAELAWHLSAYVGAQKHFSVRLVAQVDLDDVCID
jgi:hypothetical protein